MKIPLLSRPYPHLLPATRTAQHAHNRTNLIPALGRMRLCARARASLLLRVRDACAAPAALLATAAFHLHPKALQACCGCMAQLARAHRTRMKHLNEPARVLLAWMVWLLPLRQAHRQ